MRGPALVGYPPTGLRWSVTARASTSSGRRATKTKPPRGWSLRTARACAACPRRPAAGPAGRRPMGPRPAAGPGRRSRRHRAARHGRGTRTELTRTAGGESSPRWARDETHVTFVRDGGLFLLPLAGGGIQQIAESGQKTRSQEDRQPGGADRRGKRSARARARDKRKRERDEARREKEALPKLELRPTDRRRPATRCVREVRVGARDRAPGVGQDCRCPRLRHRNRPTSATCPGGPRSVTSRTRCCWQCSICSRARPPGSRCRKPAAPRRSHESSVEHAGAVRRWGGGRGLGAVVGQQGSLAGAP